MYAWVKDAAGNISNPLSSVVVFSLPEINTTEDISICEGDTYEGWTTTGRYQRVLTSSTGADSIVMTELTVNPIYYISEDIVILEGEDYLGWNKAGRYERTFTSSTGCDSIIITNLLVEPLQMQSIELESGWNIFSSYLIPADVDMGTVLEDLQENNQLLEVQDERGRSYQEIDHEWNNAIGEMIGSEGYKIKVNSSCVLGIEGYPITLPYRIELYEGWNIISFPYYGSADAMTVLQPLIDDEILLKVQDEKGNSIEDWGSSIGWINGIGTITAGEGYLVQVSQNGILPIFDYWHEKSAALSPIEPEPSYFHVVYDGNGFAHMNINITGLKEADLKAGDEIAAFDGGICVGVTKLEETNIKNNVASIHASSSDKETGKGFNEGNLIELRIWSNNKESDEAYTTNIINGEMRYQKQGSVFVQLNEVKKFINDNLKLNEIEIFPNPTTDKITINFPNIQEKDTRIIIADITGKLLINQEVKSHSVQLDISNQPSGVYLVKIVSGDRYSYKKVIKY